MYVHPMRHEITNNDAGRFQVRTATGSEYVISLSAVRRISRRMAAAPPADYFLDAGISELRRDGEELDLLMLETCRVGSPARFWIQVRADHIPTLRTTSPVVRIVPMEWLYTRQVQEGHLGSFRRCLGDRFPSSRSSSSDSCSRHVGGRNYRACMTETTSPIAIVGLTSVGGHLK